MGDTGEAGKTEDILVVDKLSKYYRTGMGSETVRAVDNVSFSIRKGSTLGLVGESGSGKTSLVRTIMRLSGKSGGSVYFSGEDVFSLSQRRLRRLRPRIQMVFQESSSSLPPYLNVRDIILEAVREHEIVRRDALDAYLRSVMISSGLPLSLMSCYPDELSQGQRQRLVIARALALKPEMLILDEPVSSLDSPMQAQIVSLIMSEVKKRSLTCLLVSHDLSLVEYLSDDCAVMYMGKIVEYCRSGALFDHPLHPYTKELLSSRVSSSPSFPRPVKGCVFAPRCPSASVICRSEEPPVTVLSDGRKVMCHLYGREFQARSENASS